MFQDSSPSSIMARVPRMSKIPGSVINYGEDRGIEFTSRGYQGRLLFQDSDRSPSTIMARVARTSKINGSVINHGEDRGTEFTN